MTDEPEDKRGGSCAIFAALGLVALVVAYPLSAGPVEWLSRHGYLSQQVDDFLRTIYYPLQRLYEHSEAFARFADWYMDLWD